MKQKKIYLGFDDIVDAKHLGSSEAFFHIMRAYLEDGWVIVIEQRFANAPPEKITELRCVQSLERWANQSN